MIGARFNIWCAGCRRSIDCGRMYAHRIRCARRRREAEVGRGYREIRANVLRAVAA